MNDLTTNPPHANAESAGAGSMITAIQGIFRKEQKPAQAREVNVPRIGSVRLEYVGTVKYHGKVPRYGNKFERVIAGERIPDSQRTAYRAEHEVDKINLAPMRGAVSGTMGFVDFHDAIYGSDGVYVAMLGVEKKFRRLGVGTALVSEVERMAIERGRPNAWCYVDNKRKEVLLHFYSALGYKDIEGDAPDWSHFRFETTMVKSLART
jgi:GNAT superfamily N-acetyltransferase